MSVVPVLLMPCEQTLVPIAFPSLITWFARPDPEETFAPRVVPRSAALWIVIVMIFSLLPEEADCDRELRDDGRN